MDGIAENISKILENPEQMETLTAMANSLFSGENNGGENKKEEQPSGTGSALGGLSDIADMGTILKIGKALQSGVTDERSQLLLALKPHLSPERRPRVDKAVKILRLISLVPILREQGVLNL